MKSIAILNECGFSETQIQQLKDKFTDSVFFTDTSSEAQAINRIGHRNIVIMDQFMFSFSEDLLKKCTGVELIILNTTTYETINTELLKKYNIRLENLKAYATLDVAEIALSMILALNNRTQIAQKLVLEKKINDFYPNHPLLKSVLRKQLSRQTIGIIGLGKIGQLCAKLCKPLSSKVIGFNRTPRPNSPVPTTSLKTLCKISDIILITLAYKKGEMDHFIDTKLLSSIKDDAIIVSISHPNLIDINYLIEHPKKFSGIGFDYLVTEGIRGLLQTKRDNLIITPHLGSQSQEAIEKMTQGLIEIAMRYK